MNKLTSAGPIMDTNWVFDSVNTAATAPVYTVAQKEIIATGGTAATGLGGKPNIEFTFNFASFTAAKVTKIAAPFNINMQFAKQADRAVGTDAAVQLYAKDYTEWTWTAKCTNTQFGKDDADTTDTVKATTLKVTDVPCAVDKTTGDLVISMTEDLTISDAADWATMNLRFNIVGTLPTDRSTSTTTVSTWLSDPNSNQVWGTGNLASVFGPTKPTGQLDT
jgi:hypothetical protein